MLGRYIHKILYWDFKAPTRLLGVTLTSIRCITKKNRELCVSELASIY